MAKRRDGKIGFSLAVIIIAVAAAVLSFSPRCGNIFHPEEKTTTSIHMIARQYLESAQMISLHCNYTDVFELSEERLKNIYGMSIPGTGKHLIVKTKGTVFLGIDCKDITTDTTRFDTLFMMMPPIKIIAHEFEFTDMHDLSGVFRKYNVKDIPELRNNYKINVEFNTVNDRSAISLAETAMEKAFRNIPTLKDVPIVFEWERAAHAQNITVDFKRDAPIESRWEIDGN